MPTTADRGVEKAMAENGLVEALAKRLNVLYCLDCGKCTATCPVAAVKEGFSPRRIVEQSLMENGNGVSDNRFIWDCLTCNKCSNYCPEDVHFPEFVKALRTLAARNGNISVMNHGGVTYSIASMMARKDLEQQRIDWAKDVKIAEKGDVLLFTGCMVYFDRIFEPLGIDGSQNILAQAVRIMNKAGITPAVLKNEVCCGHDQLWSGDEDTFKALMMKNLKAIKNSGAKRIVTVCPECARTLKKDYSELGGSDLDVIHITELLAELIEKGKITLRHADGKVTFQDPCRLVQHLKVIEGPRAVIKAVNEEGFVEMRDSKELASCCGTTLFRNCDNFSEAIRIDRLKQVKEAGADTVLTACPKCQIHLRCTLSGKCEEKGVDQGIEVKDLVTYVAENME
jgi:Fe-S oxidoreductase